MMVSNEVTNMTCHICVETVTEMKRQFYMVILQAIICDIDVSYCCIVRCFYCCVIFLVLQCRAQHIVIQKAIFHQCDAKMQCGNAENLHLNFPH